MPCPISAYFGKLGDVLGKLGDVHLVTPVLAACSNSSPRILGATSHLYPAEESTDGNRDDRVNVVNVPKFPDDGSDRDSVCDRRRRCYDSRRDDFETLRSLNTIRAFHEHDLRSFAAVLAS